MNDARRFEATILPWLDAAYNLARWLLRDDAAAEDAMQEAALRAFRYFGSLKVDDQDGPAARAWFLGIVRNVCFAQLERRRDRREVGGLEDEAMDQVQLAAGPADPRGTAPEQSFDDKRRRAEVDRAIRALPPPMREVIVLRELEELDYREIAQIAGIPIGTVMSRLSRARGRLRDLLSHAGLRG